VIGGEFLKVQGSWFWWLLIVAYWPSRCLPWSSSGWRQHQIQKSAGKPCQLPSCSRTWWCWPFRKSLFKLYIKSHVCTAKSLNHFNSETTIYMWWEYMMMYRENKYRIGRQCIKFVFLCFFLIVFLFASIILWWIKMSKTLKVTFFVNSCDIGKCNLVQSKVRGYVSYAFYYPKKTHVFHVFYFFSCVNKNRIRRLKFCDLS